MKIKSAYFLKSSIVFGLLFTCLTHLSAQFLNSVGLTAGLTYGNERLTRSSPDERKSEKYIWGYNGSVFAEFLNDEHIHWVSEFQFNQKGSTENEDQKNDATKLNYLGFNNYLKIRVELLTIIPYFLVGPRVEYRLSGESDFPEVTGSFNLIHLSIAAGAGIEFVAYGPLKFFTEFFYNPDAMPAYQASNLKIRNNSFELRVGLKWVFSKRKKGMDCNAPVYVPL